jgi:uncharacterized membrane protein YphA (DoxX/SURF4 family)
MKPESTAPPAIAARPHPEPGNAGQHWSLAERLLLRVALFFFVLHIIPFPIPQLATLLSGLPEDFLDTGPRTAIQQFVKEWVSDPLEKAMDKAVVWTGQHVFGIEITYRPGGSGDTTFNYVQEFMFAAVAISLALIWSLIAWVRWRMAGREHPAYPRLHEWLRVYVRFFLAYMMLVYGLGKVIKLQFPYPDTNGLLVAYGESSPMRLLWTFMGASESYTIFAGAGEVVGGLLLCTRRTTLLGSLVTFGVMSHVVALNFSYDVPVKLFSSLLVLMAIFLMAPDLPWMARVFVLGKRILPRPIVSLTRWRWLNWTLVILRTVIVAGYIALTINGNLKASREFGDLAPKPPLFGMWEVDEFSLDGAVRPPLTTDTKRWQHVIFTAKSFRGPLIMITPMKGPPTVYKADVDLESKAVALSSLGAIQGAEPVTYVLKLQDPEEGVIVLEGELGVFANGKIEKAQVRVVLRHIPEEGFLLKSRGFHWINEMPYNRSAPRGTPAPGLPPAPKRS